MEDNAPLTSDFPPKLASAGWLTDPAVQTVFRLLREDADGARVIGGAVRDALLERAVEDIDFATVLVPEEVVARARKAGIRVIPTGIDHGTVTVLVEGRGFEVTTLREDIETDGRHALVRFGRDWEADARRRDFTLNALSIDEAGTVYDPIGGYPDLRAGQVRFIGDPDRRIAEDRLRILRLFRLQATYGRRKLRNDDLAAVIRARRDLTDLSAERIGAEMRRLVVAPYAADTLGQMQDCGILPIILAGVGFVAAFRRLVDFEAAVGASAAVPPRLAALSAPTGDDVERLAGRLRLSNAETGRMQAAITVAGSTRQPIDDRRGLRMLYGHGGRAYRDGIALMFARSAGPLSEAWTQAYHLPDRESIPVFPLSGRDVTALGVSPGPRVGHLLQALESWWIDREFVPNEVALRARLQGLVAAAQ